MESLNQILTPTRGNSKMASITGKGSTHGAQAMFIKALTNSDRRTVSEFIKISTDQATRELGDEERGTAKEHK